MIQSTSMLDALQRGFMGLGQVGEAINQKKKLDSDLQTQIANRAAIGAQTAGDQARTAGTLQENAARAQTMAQTLKENQLKASLDQNLQDTQEAANLGSADSLNGVAGPKPAGDFTSYVASPAATAKANALPQDRANLIARLYAANGQYDKADPKIASAMHDSALTQAKNAGVKSNQEVTGNQITNDTGSLGLAKDKATQAADIAVKNMGPQAEQAKIGLTSAQTNEANSKAAKDAEEAKAGGNPKEITSVERQAKERFDKAGKETGFDGVKDNWANIQSAYTQANDPKVKDKVATDYTILDQYLKMVNPGMGVRAANMEQFATSMGLSDKLKTGMLKVQQGGKFDPQVRDDIKQMAQAIYANHEKSYLEKLNSIDEGLTATPGASRERVFGKTMAGRISGSTGAKPASDPLGLF